MDRNIDTHMALIHAVLESKSWEEFQVNLVKQTIKAAEEHHFNLGLFANTSPDPALVQDMMASTIATAEELKKFLPNKPGGPNE